MTRNKKKLRRAERNSIYARAAKTLIITSMLVSSAGAAQAAALNNIIWGSATTTDASQTINGTTGSVGVWRDYTKLPGQAYNGDLTLSKNTALIVDGRDTDLLVGGGDFFLQGSLSLINGGRMLISGGDMIIADGATLITTHIDSNFRVRGNLTAQGKVVSSPLNGSTIAVSGDLDWGDNDLILIKETALEVDGDLTAKSIKIVYNGNTLTSGASMVVRGNVTAKTLDIESGSSEIGGNVNVENLNISSAATFNMLQDVVVTGTATLASAKPVNFKNATFADVSVKNSTLMQGNDPIEADVTVTNRLTAGKVTLNTTATDTKFGLILGNAEESTTHTAKSVELKRGTLTLTGGGSATNPITPTLITTEGLHFTASSAEKAILAPTGSTAQVTGGIYAENGKKGTIDLTAGGAGLHADSLTVDGRNSAVHLKGKANTQSMAQFDTVTLTSGGSVVLDDNVTLQISGEQASGITEGKVVVKDRTIAAVDGDYTYTADAGNTGLRFDPSNTVASPAVSTGAVAVNGQLTLKGTGTITTSGITLNNAKATTASANTVNGSLWAETLHMQGTNTVTLTGGQTSDHSQLQLVGNGGNFITSDQSSTPDILLSGSGSLGLGSSAKSDNYIGAGLGAKPSGTLEKVTFSDNTGRVVFHRGDITVKNMVDASGNGTIMLSDTVTGSTVTNNLTLGTGNDATQAFDINKLTLGGGDFTVNGGTGFAVNGTATIDFESGDIDGKLDKLTLDGANAKLATGASGNATYTIGELKLTNAANAVEINKYTVTTDTLNLNGVSVTSGNLKVGGTAAAANSKGTWQINNISGASSADFTVSGYGTLLLGKDITVGNSSGTTFTMDGTAYGVKGTDATATLGSTGTMTLTTNTSKFTVGTTAAAGAINQSISAKVIALNSSGTLDIASGSASVMGDGTTLFKNTTEVNVGSNTAAGTLKLGFTNSDDVDGETVITTAEGGTYDGVITLGNNTTAGTLAVEGGNFTLSKVDMDSAKKATITLNGTGTLDIKTKNSVTDYTQGITLNGTADANTHTMLIGSSAATDYAVTGGIKVTKGTVTVANTTNLTGGVVLQGANATDALFTVSGGSTTVDSLTIAEGKTGTVTLAAGARLTVNGDLDLHKGALNIASNRSETNPLTTTGTLTTGAVSTATTPNAGASQFQIENDNHGAKINLTAQSWAVKDTSDADAAIAIAANRKSDNSLQPLNVVLNMGTGTGDTITAKSFMVGEGATVGLRGEGGNIKLTGTGQGEDALRISGDASVLEVGESKKASHWSTDKLNMGDGGKLSVAHGSFSVNTLSTDGQKATKFSIGKKEDNLVSALRIKDSSFTNPVNEVFVERGYIQFGSNSAELDTAINQAMTARNANAGLVVTGKQLELNGKVSMAVGDSLLREANTILGKGNTVFAPDSLLFIDLDTVGQTDYAIKSASDLYIEEGSQIAVHRAGGIRVGDSLKILSTQPNGIKGEWSGLQSSTNSRLLSLTMHTSADHSKLDGIISAADATKTMPGLSRSMADYLAHMVRTVGVDNDSANAGVRFISRMADMGYLPDANLAAPTIEGAAQTAVVGATPGMTYTASNIAVNAVTTRTAFASPLLDMSRAVAVNMDQNGTLALDGLNAGDGMKNGVGLWFMPLYQSERVHGMQAGNFKTGYNADLGGAALGVDYTFADSYRIGLALNVGGGRTSSSGDFNSTKNSFNFWGASLYGGWTLNNFGLTADLGYTSTDNKLTQQIPGTLQMDNLKSDVTSRAITAGLRAEYKWQTAPLDVIPHASVRYTNLNTSSYDVKSNGTVFSVASSKQNIWTMPVGVAFSKTVGMNSGWYFKPQVDLGFILAAGDLKAKSSAHIPGVSGSALMETKVTDNLTWQASLGADFKRGDLSFGVNYNIQVSDHRTGHGVFGTLRYEF